MHSTPPSGGFLLTFMCATTCVAPGQYPLNQQLDLAACGLFTKDAGFDHLGVVEHQQVAWLQQAGQVFEDAVHGLSSHVRPAMRECAALGSRVLGNQFWGEVKVEIAQA